ncbi:hypothetical protein V6N12_059597 [Hibiscus sabdariffa]|uniref:Uncharacterized protein n=1 Tax=Hibiscus sabdariffa TaxID=183260 RepID=A0ABR2EXY8_9ROSI
MAGWDEETLIIATLVVQDTPDRQSKHKKRSDFNFKTLPSANSRSPSPALECMDKLREELSCAQWNIMRPEHGSLEYNPASVSQRGF